MESNKVLDATELSCPMPVVKTKMAIDKMNTGEILEVHATDKGSKTDIAAWVKSGNHELVKQTEEDGLYKFWIKKG